MLHIFDIFQNTVTLAARKRELIYLAGKTEHRVWRMRYFRWRASKITIILFQHL